MRTRLFLTLIFAIISLLSISAKGQSPQDSITVKQLLKLADEAREAALHGDAIWQEQHLMQNFTAIEPNGEIKSKTEAIQMRKAGTVKFDSIVVLDRKVKVYGETGIVITKAKIRIHINGQEINTGSWLTTIWVKNGSSWMETASQSTSISTKQ